MRVDAAPGETGSLPALQSSQQENVALQFFLWALILIQCALRFLNLESSPPGFYLDEATGAINAICLREVGESETGLRYPLFFPASGSYHPPTWIYSAALWSGIFGTSIRSFRALPAFLTTLTLVGIYVLARRFLGSQGALISLLSAAISPWGFQFSRIAWEGPMLPMLSVWGTYFFLRSNRHLDQTLAGVLFGLALYSYAPGRLLVPLLVALLLILKWTQKSVDPKALAVFLTVVATLSLPLLYYVLFTDLQARFNVLSIFSDYYLRQFDNLSTTLVLGIFAKNLLRHLHPRFLFLHGDRNLRHSPQFVGELSWLDVMAIVLAVTVLLRILSKKSASDVPVAYLAFSALGFLSALVPAALTWEGIPHALRSIAGWPFLALFTGAVLTVSCRLKPRLALGVASAALLFMSYFHVNYLMHYPALAKPWFDHEIKETVLRAQSSGDWDAIKSLPPRYSRSALKYYLVHYGNMSCKSTEEFLGERQGSL